MFKVPDWDTDIKNEINLNMYKSVKKNKRNETKPLNSKENGVKKTSFKTKKKNFKMINNIDKSNGTVSNIKAHVNNENKDKIIRIKKQKPKIEKKCASLKTVKQSVSTDKLDELILIEKKRKRIKNYTKNIGKSEEPNLNGNRHKLNKYQGKKVQNIINKISNTKSIDSEKFDESIPTEKLAKPNKNQSEKKKNININKDKKSFDSGKLERLINNVEEKSNNETKQEHFNIDTDSFDVDKLDEFILKEKKKKLNNYNNDDIEEILFTENANKKRKLPSSTEKEEVINNRRKTSSNEGHETSPLNGSQAKKKDERKKKLLKSVLQKESQRTQIKVCGSNSLRDRMLERLNAAKFRYLNEKLYTSSGSEAQQIFQSDPSAFQTYHQGYQQQVKKWPVKPLDVIIKRIQKMPKTYKIADMGCGEAELSQRVSQKVRSFDLVATSPRVEACDISRTPLLTSEVDVAVYCLALMGTDLTQYLLEANRVLKMSGHLLIAEVESRFSKVDDFIRDVQKIGFSLKKLDKSQTVFFFMEFTKVRDPPAKKAKLPTLTLKPCNYKKR